MRPLGITRLAVTAMTYTVHMVIGVVREHGGDGWVVTMIESSWRSERRSVHVGPATPSDADVEACCVGFADDNAEADRMFDAVVRAMTWAHGDEVESVDWMDVPDGFDL